MAEQHVVLRMAAAAGRLDIVNPQLVEPCMFSGTEWFDAGPLPTPKPLVVKTLEKVMKPELVELLMPALGGLTIREIGEVVRLTMARDKTATHAGLLTTRKQLFHGSRGISIIDTNTPLYWPQEEVGSFVKSNKQFFLEASDPRLRPRGIMFKGVPGTGKSMGAKYIAREWGVPLYRLDATVQSKWVGACHSADTEFLTEAGPKSFADIGDTELLATLNTNNGRLEFQKPTARHVYHFDGELVHIHNRRVDALVTDNHRLYLARGQQTANFEFVEASAVEGLACHYIRMPQAALSWEGNEVPQVSVPYAMNALGKNGRQSSSPTKFFADDFLKFLGYFVSEGSTDAGHRGVFLLHQKDGIVLEDMFAVCTRLFGRVTCIKGPKAVALSMSNLHVWTWLREHCGERSYVKRLPTWVLNLSYRQLPLVLAPMIDGDGSIPAKGRDGAFMYATTSKLLAEQVTGIAIRLGFAVRNADSQPPGNRQRRYEVHCSPHTNRSLTKADFNRVPYQGAVVCFSVPNGTLFTRRNGRWLISGNSSVRD